MLYIIAFFTRVWFCISQFFTGFGGQPLPHFKNVGEIVEALNYGLMYKKDTKLGAMTHPMKVQYRINQNIKLGDCEDHAGYWALGLLNSLLSFEVYICLLYYMRDGKKLGHSAVVFRRGGHYYWADYNTPVLLTSLEGWTSSMLLRYGDKFRGGVLFRVREGGVRGQLRIGEIRTFPVR